MKKLVIADISRLAGVSRSTVSKAINDYGDIPDKTKKKINGIIRKYNYFPSKSAQILRRGRADSVAFISGRISSHFTVEILSAIERRTFSTGKFLHRVVPYSTNYQVSNMREIFRKIIYGREASAIVALAMNPEPGLVMQCKKAGIPLILIENFSKKAHTVNTDNRKAGFMAAEYLIKKGRKRIALICGGLKAGSRCGYSYAAVERKSGFDAALDAGGVKNGPDYMELAEYYTIEEGMIMFGNMLKKGVKPDAVFCASGDMTAVGVMEAAKKRGMRIPDDLAVLGFDDSGCSAYLNPPLSTIRQPIDSIGREVLDTAISAAEGRLKGFRHVLLQPELIVRTSA